MCVILVPEPKPAVKGELSKHPLCDEDTSPDVCLFQARCYHWPSYLLGTLKKRGVKKFGKVVRPISVKTTTGKYKST